jgi:hypothetical protein
MNSSHISRKYTKTGLGKWPGKWFEMNDELRALFDGALQSIGTFTKKNKSEDLF